jgi:hypothetical protein
MAAFFVNIGLLLFAFFGKLFSWQTGAMRQSAAFKASETA